MPEVDALAATDLGFLSSMALSPIQTSEALPSSGMLTAESISATIRLPSRKLHLFLSVPGRPNWFEKFQRSCASLLGLEAGWDTYGAKPVSLASMRRVFVFLASVVGDSLSFPHIVPTADGTVQLEWHESDIDLEVEFKTTGELEVYFCDSRTGESRESEITEFQDDALRYAFEALANRKESKSN